MGRGLWGVSGCEVLRVEIFWRVLGGDFIVCGGFVRRGGSEVPEICCLLYCG